MKIKQYAEAELTTVSVVNAKAVLPREMLLIMLLTAPNNYIFKERLKEVLTIKAFILDKRNCELQRDSKKKRNEAADVVVITLYVKGKISTEAVSWQYYFNSLD